MKQIVEGQLKRKPYQCMQSSYRKLKKYIRKCERFLLITVLYPALYHLFCIRSIKKNKAVFVEVRLEKISDSLLLLYQQMKKRDFDIHEHYLRSGFVPSWRYVWNCMLYIRDIADAKYIFISDAVNILGRLKLRNGTKMIQTWHGCGAFKKFGYSTCELIFGPGRKELNAYPTSNNYTFVTVSSSEVIWAYQEAMGIPKEKILPLGISRTDVFFDKDFLKEARRRVWKRVPETVGKKVILYAPTFRGRVANAMAPDQFSISKFFEAFSKEYVLLIKQHPLVKKRPIIPKEYGDFAFDVSDCLDIESLLITADLCITDYSSLIFEYSLLERPMIFFAYDVENYCDWRGFYYNYEELTPGPVYRTNEEMIEYIKQIDNNFEKEQVSKFKDKFMSACDGRATERILERVLADE